MIVTGEKMQSQVGGEGQELSLLLWKLFLGDRGYKGGRKYNLLK